MGQQAFAQGLGAGQNRREDSGLLGGGAIEPVPSGGGLELVEEITAAVGIGREAQSLGPGRRIWHAVHLRGKLNLGQPPIDEGWEVGRVGRSNWL